MMLGGRGVSPIGLDLGRQAIKAVQWAGSAGSPRIVASARIARTDESAIPTLEESSRLAEILWRRGFQGRRVVVGVPESSSLTAVVEVPPANAGAPVRQIAAGELARLHGTNVEDLETDSWMLPAAGSKGQRHEAVAVGVRRGEMLALLDSLQARDGAGFEVVAADASVCARVRAATLGLRTITEAWALLDMGWSSSRLSVVHDRLIIYDRALPDSGLAHLELRLEQDCALKPEDIRYVLGQTAGAAPRRVSGAWQGAIGTYTGILAGEVQDSLRYLALHRGIAMPRMIVLTGGGAESAPVLEHLSKAMDGMNVTPAPPARPVQTDDPGAAGGAAPAAGSVAASHPTARRQKFAAPPALWTALGLSLWAA